MKKNNKERLLAVPLTGILLLYACSSASGIQISQAWTRPALKDGNGAVYFLLQNHSAFGDELTGASSTAAGVVEMHESRLEGDVMKMQQLASIPIPGKVSLEFAPGGLHLMLIGLKEDLKVGDEIQVTLHFAEHEDITLDVPVLERQGENPTNDH